MFTPIKIYVNAQCLSVIEYALVLSLEEQRVISGKCFGNVCTE